MKRKGAVFALLVAICLVLPGCKKAGGDLAEVEPKNIDPWEYIKDVSISGSQPIRNLASSAGGLGVTVGVMGIVLSILYMAVRVLFGGGPKTRNEVKEEAVVKGFVAIMIFSVPFWLGMFKLISELLI